MSEDDTLKRIWPYVHSETEEALARIKVRRGGTAGSAIDALVGTFGELPNDVSAFLAEACERGLGDVAAGSWAGIGKDTAPALRRIRDYLAQAGGAPMREVDLAEGRYARVPSSWLLPNEAVCGRYLAHVEVRGSDGVELSVGLMLDEVVEGCGEDDRRDVVEWLMGNSPRFKSVLGDRKWSAAVHATAAYSDPSELGDAVLVVMRTLMPVESYGGAEPPYGAAVYRREPSDSNS